ncbi:hypothetical protein ABK046_16630 [Streptomyces caeruleatus]
MTLRTSSPAASAAWGTFAARAAHAPHVVRVSLEHRQPAEGRSGRQEHPTKGACASTAVARVPVIRSASKDERAVVALLPECLGGSARGEAAR